MNDLTAYACPDCNLRVAPRQGREPNFCPQCGAALQVVNSTPSVTGFAVASLLVGVFVLFGPLGPMSGLVGIGSGIIAHIRIRDAHGHLTGAGIATAGILLSLIGAAIQLLRRRYWLP